MTLMDALEFGGTKLIRSTAFLTDDDIAVRISSTSIPNISNIRAAVPLSMRRERDAETSDLMDALNAGMIVPFGVYRLSRNRKELELLTNFITDGELEETRMNEVMNMLSASLRSAKRVIERDSFYE